MRFTVPSSAFQKPRCVLFPRQLRPRGELSTGRFASAQQVVRSPFGSVGPLRCVGERIAFASAACQLRQSPKTVLAPVLQASKRAALAMKVSRSARRLATHAAGQPGQNQCVSSRVRTAGVR